MNPREESYQVSLEGQLRFDEALYGQAARLLTEIVLQEALEASEDGPLGANVLLRGVLEYRVHERSALLLRFNSHLEINAI